MVQGIMAVEEEAAAVSEKYGTIDCNGSSGTMKSHWTYFNTTCATVILKLFSKNYTKFWAGIRKFLFGGHSFHKQEG